MRRAVVPVLMVGLLTACGSTVQVQSQGTSLTGDGLSAPSGSVVGTAPGDTTTTDPGTTSAGGSGGTVSGTTGAIAPSTGTAVHPGSTASRVATPVVTAASAKVTTPIQIGFMAAASAGAALSAVGSSGGSTSETPQEAFAYFVNQLNSKGGLNGRKIQVVQSFIDPTSSNYDTQAQAACANFTQDHHVAAVMAIEGTFYSENFSACLAKAHVPELLAIIGGTTSSTLNKYPLLVSPTAPSIERRFAAMITGLTGNGFLTAKNKVGIIVEDCPQNEAVYSSTIVPMLKAHGITPTRRDVSCVHGFGDAANYIGSMGAQVLPLESQSVDRVMFVSGFEAFGAQYFEKQAKNQGYHPSYALTSTSDVGDNSLGFDAEANSRVQGVGWAADLDSTKLLPGSAATQRCRALWKGFGPASARNNRTNNEFTCEEFFLLEAALAKTNGSSQATNLVQAIQSLGTSFVSAFSLGGATAFSPGHKDGPQLFATFGYGSGCGCFAYTSSPKPLA